MLGKEVNMIVKDRFVTDLSFLKFSKKSCEFAQFQRAISHDVNFCTFSIVQQVCALAARAVRFQSSLSSLLFMENLVIPKRAAAFVTLFPQSFSAWSM